MQLANFRKITVFVLKNVKNSCATSKFNSKNRKKIVLVSTSQSVYCGNVSRALFENSIFLGRSNAGAGCESLSRPLDGAAMASGGAVGNVSSC